MSAVLATKPKADARIGVIGAIATCVAIIGWLATDLVAAVPAGACLTVVAATDLSTRRFSIRTLGIASLLVALALGANAAAEGSLTRLTVVLSGTAAVGGLLGLVWLAIGGLAFGDVLLVAFTISVPLHVSARAAAVTISVALAAAALTVLARAVMQRSTRGRSVALAPALLVGWVCGLVVG
jgi:hypothetical protein